VNLIKPEHLLPKLPDARAVWIPEPNLKVAATAWITAGGAHHTALACALTFEHLENFAEIAALECLLTDQDTKLSDFTKELRWNDLYYHLASGI
jgi:L-arabinose isomerase